MYLKIKQYQFFLGRLVQQFSQISGLADNNKQMLDRLRLGNRLLSNHGCNSDFHAQSYLKFKADPSSLRVL